MKKDEQESDHGQSDHDGDGDKKKDDTDELIRAMRYKLEFLGNDKKNPNIDLSEIQVI